MVVDVVQQYCWIRKIRALNCRHDANSVVVLYSLTPTVQWHRGVRNAKRGYQHSLKTE
jgi:hypothetical protein